MKINKVLLIIILGLLPLSSYAWTPPVGLVDMVANLQRSLQPIWQFLIALSYVLGVWFVGLAIFKLKQYGQMTVMMSTHAALGPSVAFLVVGAGLLYLPTLLDTTTLTIWGYATGDIRGYDEATNFADIMTPLLQLVQVLGLISFIKGWVMMAKLGGQGQPGTFIKGFMHIFGGILAINVVGTIDVLKATFGIG